MSDSDEPTPDGSNSSPDQTTVDDSDATSDRPRYRRLQDRLRVFNRHVLNPVMLRFAGRPYVPYGLVRHVGRRSGRTYDTPVLVGTTGDRVVVPLIYGADTDWCRNVRAAGGCTVAWQGEAFEATSPRLVEPGAAGGAFPGWLRRVAGLVGAEQHLALDRGREVPEEYREMTAAHPVRPVLVALVGLVAVAVLLWWVATSGA